MLTDEQIAKKLKWEATVLARKLAKSKLKNNKPILEDRNIIPNIQPVENIIKKIDRRKNTELHEQYIKEFGINYKESPEWQKK